MNDLQRQELLDLASRAIDGALAPAEQTRLESLLSTNPEARALYVRFMGASSGIAWAARSETRLPAHPRASALPRRAWWAAAAAALLLAAGLTAWLLPHNARSGGTDVALAGPVATFQENIDVVWADGGEPSHVSNVLPKGSLQLKSGLAQIQFLGGAAAWLEGPLSFELRGPGEAYCASGRVLVDVPPEAVGFRLLSPFGTVIDRGTGFGVLVQPDQMAVHVFKGQVDVEVPGGPTKRIQAGEALLVRAGGITTLAHADLHAFDHEGFSRTALPAWPPPRSRAPHDPMAGGPPDRGWGDGSWKGADPLDPYRSWLQASPDRWYQLEPLLADWSDAQRRLYAPNVPESALARAQWDLWLAVMNPDSTDEELLRRLRAFREARQAAREDLHLAEESLKFRLTPREEAILVTRGALP